MFVQFKNYSYLCSAFEKYSKPRLIELLNSGPLLARNDLANRETFSNKAGDT